MRPVAETPFCTVTPVVVSQTRLSQSLFHGSDDQGSFGRQQSGGTCRGDGAEEDARPMLPPQDSVCYVCQLEGVPGNSPHISLRPLQLNCFLD